jgi:hypothetical protein
MVVIRALKLVNKRIKKVGFNVSQRDAVNSDDWLKDRVKMELEKRPRKGIMEGLRSGKKKLFDLQDFVNKV